MNGPFSRLLGWAFALALIFHWAILNIPIPEVFTAPQFSSKSKDPIVVESYKDPNRKPVVETSRIREEADAKDKEARFAGEERNRVQQEMQASVKGRFEEGQIAKGEGKGSGGEGSKGHMGEDAGEEPVEEGKGGRAGGPGLSDLMRLGRSPHALPDDIREGNQTILNTDKVLYASFINRIAEEIYDPWVRFGQDALQEMQFQGRKLTPNIYITKLNVTMDSAGEVKGIQILGGSGVTELDNAPKKAFFEVAVFPNPPAQLLDEDGFIRLTYEFHFEFKTSSFNIIPWAI